MYQIFGQAKTCDRARGLEAGLCRGDVHRFTREGRNPQNLCEYHRDYLTDLYIARKLDERHAAQTPLP